MPDQPPSPLRLGTRGSPLALVQAGLVRDALVAAHGWDAEAVEIVPIKTSGDRVQDRALAEIGGKALWTRELDRALADGRVDFNVHSMKDVETIRPTEIALAALLPRADVRDRLIGAASIEALAPGALVGTASPRRAAQLLRLRPGLDIGLLRGNVATRLAAVSEGRFAATLLAAAGLDRLGHHDVGAAIALETMLPAPQQGAIGVETLAAREDMREALAAIDDGPTRACVMAERALLYALGADCQSPVAALARIEKTGAGGDVMTIEAQLLTNDGAEAVSGRRKAGIEEGEAAARALAAELLGRASARLKGLFAG